MGMCCIGPAMVGPGTPNPTPLLKSAPWSALPTLASSYTFGIWPCPPDGNPNPTLNHNHNHNHNHNPNPDPDHNPNHLLCLVTSRPVACSYVVSDGKQSDSRQMVVNVVKGTKNKEIIKVQVPEKGISAHVNASPIVFGKANTQVLF